MLLTSDVLTSTYHYQALDEYAHRSRNFGGRSDEDINDWSTDDKKNNSLQGSVEVL